MAALPESLLDFSKPFDVGLLDAVVGQFYAARSTEERVAAEKILTALKEHPDTWTRVADVLESSASTQTRFFALQVLEDACRYKWGALALEHREGIKSYLTNLIIKVASDEATFTGERTLLNKLDVVLVQILKHDWPAKWPSFIPDLVAASRQSETLCENSMILLKLLSEEIFDFSRDELVGAKTKQLKNQLNTEFKEIHELCMFVLQASRRPSLLEATLTALHSYLGWVPLMYVFDTPLVELLLQLFPEPAFRNHAVKCLTEVASVAVTENFEPFFVNLWTVFMSTLETRVIPPGVDIAKAFEGGSEGDQAFVAQLSLFLTGIFKSHMPALEARPEGHAQLLRGLELLLGISYVDDQEIFKTCLDFWRKFAHDLYMRECCAGVAGAANQGGSSLNGAPLPGSPFPVGQAPGSAPAAPPGFWQDLYRHVLRHLRLLMIQRMAKPEEVIVVVDENGNVVREVLSNAKDHLDVLQQHKVMMDTLKYLTFLNYEETHALMLEKLQAQLNHSEWGWERLNTLCWAIGAIAGTVSEDEAENRFLVSVIKDLLLLCEKTRGKDNKAVIASNIMYVVGQYPRFLNNHWKFLKTVVYKLFEFMHELHPGVQDMACDTFLKIVQRCTRKLVTLQANEQDIFVRELLFQEMTLPDMTRTARFQEVMCDLEPGQRNRFYEAIALMIQSVLDDSHVPRMLAKLMEPPNAAWAQLLAAVTQDRNVLRDPTVMKRIIEILSLGQAACTSLGGKFLSQLEAIFQDMLALYAAYGALIREAIGEATSKGIPPEHAVRYSLVRQMRAVKRTCLKVIETFADRCDPADRHLLLPLVPPLITPVLGDYRDSEPAEAREPEVLVTLAAMINKLGDLFQPFVNTTLGSTFEATLAMITRNMEEYPEHRLGFFTLLRSVTLHCSPVLFEMSHAQLKLVLDSVIWAFRHQERNVAEVGLQLTIDLLSRFGDSPLATDFHRAFFMTILTEVLTVLTDTMHKPGFKLQVKILHHLFFMAQDPARITRPLWEPDASGVAANPPPVPDAAGPPASNVAYVRGHVAAFLQRSFANLSPVQIQACVEGMCEIREYQAFKQHIRDFLVQSRVFSDADNAELYAAAVKDHAILDPITAAKAAGGQQLHQQPQQQPGTDQWGVGALGNGLF